jgi:undecaprenyl-diphosphatase
LDFQLLHLVNVEASHPALDWLMPVLSALEIWLMPLLVLAAIACWRQPARWGRLMATMALALLLSDAVVGRSLKQFAGRQRPRDSVEGLWVRDLGKEYKGPPSNHVMNLSAAATLLVLHAPRLGPLAVGLALAVAYSRLYCAAHWPSDLPPSILLGVLCALAASNLMRRLWKGDAKGSRPVPQPKDERDSSPASDSRK